ncbi:MAG TPA: hypothetical protein DIW47_14155 [Bacteroidetes bacterium]|nr:hypothetical protein [Bacteroidota bacterium]
MKKRIPYWPYAAAILCFLYVFLRAWAIPLTYDEIWTIESLADRSLSNIFSYQGLGSNSHLLNSLFVWIIQQNKEWISLSEPFIYRLPNVLAFLLYAWFSIRLLGKLSSIPLQVMAFVFCFFNSFLLEFFSLCRGYGLALAFTAASIYSLSQYRYRLTLTWAALAVLANFTWLNFYLALLPVLVFVNWTKSIPFNRRFWAELALPTILLAILIVKPIIKLRVGDELWYGGQTGLVYDTFTSLFLGTMGFKTPDRVAHLVLLAIAIQLFLSLLISFRKETRIKHLFQSDLFVYGLVFLMLCFSSLLQNLLFKTPFLVERTSLVFLLPLIWLVIKACELAMDKKYGKIALSGLAILGTAALLNFFNLANLSYSYSWPFDAKSGEIMDYLNEQGKQRQDTLHLDHSWIINVSIQHEAKTNKYPWVNLVRNDTDSSRLAKMDYYYLYDNNREYAGYSSYQAIPDSFFRDTALYFPEQDLLLLKIRK